MNPLGSTLSPPPPGEGLAFLCGVLLPGLGGIGALCALEGRKDLARRVAWLLAGLGAAGFLVGTAWTVHVAWGRFPTAGSGGTSLRGWVGKYAYPLHMFAASLGWLLLAGFLALTLSVAGRVRRWVPAAAVLLIGLLAFLPSMGGHDEDGLGFRSRREDQRAREEQGIYEANSHEDHMAMHREILDAARWRGAALALFLGTLAAAGAGLALGRRVPGRGVMALSLLAAVAAVLWGLCGVLRVEQARLWASGATPPALIDAAFREAAVPPFIALWVAAAMCTLALRRVEEPVGESGAMAAAPGQDRSP